MSQNAPVRPWLAVAIRTSAHRPRLVLAAWAVIAGASLLGISQVQFDTSTGSVLNRTDSDWAFYRRSVAEFGGDESIVIAVRAVSPYHRDALAEVVRLTDYARQIPGVRRVDSLSSFPVIRGNPDGELVLQPVLAELENLRPSDVARIVSTDRVLKDNLASADGTVLAVNVLLDGDSAALQAEILAQIDAAIDHSVTWVSGVPVFRTRVNARTHQEILLFVPITIGLIALLLRFVFGSMAAPAISLISSSAGSLVSLGAMGLVGTPVTISTMILPSILLALGSAYAMHVLSVSSGVRTAEELERQVCTVANPIALSGLTTAVGFIALALIRIDAVRDLGAFGSLGVIGVLAGTLTLVPALLRLWGAPQVAPGLDGAIRANLRRGLVMLAGRGGAWVIGCWVGLALVSSIGLARLEVETDAVVWFPEGSRVREAYEGIREALSGISPMNVVIEGGDVTGPEVLASLDRFGEFLEGLPEVGKVVSLADPIAQLHAGFTGSSRDILPTRGDVIEEYLLLLESVEYLDDLLSWERDKTNVLLRLDNNGSEDLVAVARTAEEWWAREGAGGLRAQTTGIMHEFARSEPGPGWGQVRGLSFALVTIGGLLLLVFRWPLLAGFSVLPNVIPLVVVFGAMGLTGIPLDAVTVGLGSTALGIAVDDTIHLVSRFRGFAATAGDSLEAVDASLREVLPPLIYTTVAITTGFGVLLLSDFTVTQHLGLVTAGVVALCLLATLTLLPALLARLSVKRFQGAR